MDMRIIDRQTKMRIITGYMAYGKTKHMTTPFVFGLCPLMTHPAPTQRRAGSYNYIVLRPIKQYYRPDGTRGNVTDQDDIYWRGRLIIDGYYHSFSLSYGGMLLQYGYRKHQHRSDAPNIMGDDVVQYYKYGHMISNHCRNMYMHYEKQLDGVPNYVDLGTRIEWRYDVPAPAGTNIMHGEYRVYYRRDGPSEILGHYDDSDEA